MTYKVSKEDFVSVLVDCRGDSRDEAEVTADEYLNDLGSYISDIGGDEDSLVEAKAYLS